MHLVPKDPTESNSEYLLAWADLVILLHGLMRQCNQAGMARLRAHLEAFDPKPPAKIQ